MKRNPILIYTSGDDVLSEIHKAMRDTSKNIIRDLDPSANGIALAVLVQIEQTLLNNEENAAREAYEDTQKAAGMQAND